MATRGLTVGSSGNLLLDGARFRNIGLNYGGAIQRIYTQASPTACEYTPSSEQDAVLDIADQCKAKVLRIKAFPFWPAQWTYGLNAGKAWNVATAADREAHYLKIDAFIAKCRARGIGVFINLFFRIGTVPDLVGGNQRAWLSAGNTRTFAATLISEIVTRYQSESAVYGWEISNETNHYNDASDTTKGAWPGVNVSYGTAASYSAANNCFNGSEWASVCAWIYGQIHAIDTTRIVLTGNGPNSYSQPGGTAGISTPMPKWHEEQVRDNPTNCLSIHWYGNIGYSSNNFKGMESALCGCNHWARTRGLGFVLGEFGNQPWTLSAITTSGGIATFNVAASFPVEVGDDFIVSGAGAFDGTYILSSVDATRSTLTALCTTTGSWFGTAKVQNTTASKLTRMCNDIIKSNTDVALFWCVDLDAGSPTFNSLHDGSGNEFQRSVIAAANTTLGW